MDQAFIIAASNNPNPFRFIMYEKTAPSVAVQTIDIPAPHTSTTRVVFSGLNDVAHWARLYEFVGGVLGAMLAEDDIQPNALGVTSETPLELRVGTGVLDRITPGVNNYDGTTQYPQYAGKVAKVDYWVEQRGVGQLRDDEYVNNTDTGVTFGFKLSGSATFSDGDTYFIKWKPVVTINPASFPPAVVKLFRGIKVVTANTTINNTYTDNLIDVASSTAGTITLTLDALSNIPELGLFHFVNNRGLQTATIIKAQPMELIYFNGAEVNQIALSMGGTLTLTKKGSRWYFVDGNVIEPKRYVGTAGEPAFSGTWGNYTTGIQEPVGFRKDWSKNIVYLFGNAYNPTGTIPANSGLSIFTLPVGYRPNYDSVVVRTLNERSTFHLIAIYVSSDGGVSVRTDTTTIIGPLVSLSGSYFFTDY